MYFGRCRVNAGKSYTYVYSRNWRDGRVGPWYPRTHFEPLSVADRSSSAPRRLVPPTGGRVHGSRQSRFAALPVTLENNKKISTETYE